MDHGDQGNAKLQGRDLWNRIFELVDAAPKQHFKIRWIPSHINEPHKVAEKAKALREGNATEEDILGNDAADKLADIGAKQHSKNEHYVEAAKNR